MEGEEEESIRDTERSSPESRAEKEGENLIVQEEKDEGGVGLGVYS